MKAHAKWMLLLLASFVAGGAGCTDAGKTGNGPVSPALAELKGSVKARPDGKIISADFRDTDLTDEQLALLRGEDQLTTLYLDHTQITDAGLAYLKELDTLETLSLVDTQVTDAGLEHLKELASLTTLRLQGTKVTAQGITPLREALPRTAIESDVEPTQVEPTSGEPATDESTGESPQ